MTSSEGGGRGVVVYVVRGVVVRGVYVVRGVVVRGVYGVYGVVVVVRSVGLDMITVECFITIIFDHRFFLKIDLNFNQ
jgi:hypothetical protein